MAQPVVFDYDSYGNFVRDAIEYLSAGKRGELLRLANYIGIHTSTLSQILAGKKNFTLEQACSVADFFGLKEMESRYFLLLVNLARAGTMLLRKTLEAQLKELKARQNSLDVILPQDRPLTEEEKAIFYSNWYYSAIWAQTSIDGFGTSEALQKHFALPRRLVNEVVSYLLRTGLCIEHEGQLRPGHQYTHLEAESPLISRHHANWRTKAMERHPVLSTDEVCFSEPMTISKKDALRVRKLVTDMIARVNEIRGPSPCEELHCLNVDWIRI